MSFRFPYVSIDTETTGSDTQRSHVLQIAAVYDNGKDLKELPTFNRIIRWPVITHAEAYALNLNRSLLQRAYNGGPNVVEIERARGDFLLWLCHLEPGGPFTAAGKNVGSFDLPVLFNPVNQFTVYPKGIVRFLRRVLDPGSMYAENFDHVPTMDEINTFLGRPKLSHDALEDAWDVVYSIRYKWGCLPPH